MDRLTEKAPGCFEYCLKDHKSVPGEFGTYDAFYDYSMAVKKLGSYEDTGLLPEDIDLMIECAHEDHQPLTTAAHIRELLQAETEGRLLVLPCKVGDTVYISGHKFAAQIDEIVINAMDGITLNWSEHDRGPELTELWDDGWFTPEDIGKTVFLTREEAEAVLQKEADREN